MIRSSGQQMLFIKRQGVLGIKIYSDANKVTAKQQGHRFQAQPDWGCPSSSRLRHCMWDIIVLHAAIVPASCGSNTYSMEYLCAIFKVVSKTSWGNPLPGDRFSQTAPLPPGQKKYSPLQTSVLRPNYIYIYKKLARA